MGALETADSLGQPLPGNQCPSGSTQQFLDQLTGAKSILDHLDDDDADEMKLHDDFDHTDGDEGLEDVEIIEAEEIIEPGEPIEFKTLAFYPQRWQLLS